MYIAIYNNQHSPIPAHDGQFTRIRPTYNGVILLNGSSRNGLGDYDPEKRMMGKTIGNRCLHIYIPRRIPMDIII